MNKILGFLFEIWQQDYNSTFLLGIFRKDVMDGVDDTKERKKKKKK